MDSAILLRPSPSRGGDPIRGRDPITVREWFARLGRALRGVPGPRTIELNAMRIERDIWQRERRIAAIRTSIAVRKLLGITAQKLLALKEDDPE